MLIGYHANPDGAVALTTQGGGASSSNSPLNLAVQARRGGGGEGGGGVNVNVRARTPLLDLLTSHKPDLDLARVLLEAGASPVARDNANSNATAFHVVVSLQPSRHSHGGYAGGVDVGLLVAVLEDMLVREPTVINAVDDHGNTPLHWGYHHGGSREVVRVLLDYGADAAARNAEGQTPQDLDPELLLQHQHQEEW